MYTVKVEKEYLEELIEEGLSQRGIVKRSGKSLGSVHYWLGKHSLSTKKARKKEPECSLCGEQDPKKFYGRKKSRCGSCHNQYTMAAGEEKRKRALDHLGGECVKCKYKEYYCALDIHHLDPSKKDSNFRHLRGWSWSRIEKELENCVVLCRICHSVEHFLNKDL